jgi:hypothetical protein
VIVHQSDTRDIFSRHNRRLTIALVRDHAAQMHEPIVLIDREAANALI